MSLPSNRASDEGITLVEMLVAMIVLTIAMGVITSSFIASLRTSEGVSQRQRSTDLSSTAIDAMALDLRTAIAVATTSGGLPARLPPFKLASDADVIFYASIDAGGATPSTTPYQIELVAVTPAAGVRQAVIRERITPADAGSGPTYTFTGATIRDRVLADNVPWPLPQPLFSYCDTTGCGSSSGLGSTPLSATALDQVGRVVITVPVAVVAPIPGVQLTTIVTSVDIPNHATGAVAS